MKIGGCYECELPSGRLLRFTVVGEPAHDWDIWTVEDAVLDQNGKRWMFRKDSWIEKNATEVPYL